MKTKKVFMLVVFFFILIIMSLLVFAEDSEKQASDFQSNGDLIEGWYWLRDSALQNYVEWTFDNIPLGPEEITLQINALATDRPSGGRGFNAKFLLYYSLRGEGDIPETLILPQTVTLENILSSDDPLGYSCQGQVTIPASTLPAASRISLRIRRDSAQDNHIAFKEDSIVLLTDATHPPNGDTSLNDDDFEGATPILADTCTGSLGEEDAEGHRDDVDYYSIHLEEGQLITLQLTIPGNAQYGILLLNPNRNSQGASITQREIKTLDYIANSTGTWYIKIHRSSGEGEYQLAVDIQDQNDAENGQDAGDSYQGAILISPPGGTFTGLLKAGDNDDYYSIHLEEGQLITLQLTIPGNAQYGILLLNPNRNSQGASITQREIKTLDYIANSTGTWYIKIHRSSGEGEYQLAVDSTSNGSGGGDNHPPVISMVNPAYDSLEINHYVPIICNASDQDGDTLTLSWTANGVSVGENNSYLTWRAPATVGTYTITCTVSDGNGGEDSESVSIVVTDDSGGAGSSCSYSFSSYDSHFSSTGGSEEFTVMPSSSDFQWTAVSDVPWVQIDFGGTGPGNKTLGFSVQNNSSGEERTGYITIEDKIHTITQESKIEFNLNLSNQGRTLTSSIPIFVEENKVGNYIIDPDGDGIHQQWENDAMEYVNPYFELDEDEDWLTHPEHHVVNFVRVFPYPSEYNRQYLLFTYCVTWSRDYGRADLAGHNGDVERVIMAWKITDPEGKNLQLKKVFTSAHGGKNDHSAVWDAWNRSCFTCEVDWSLIDEEMCGQLQFENNILLLQASEDKHAIYPTKACCEGVNLLALVQEDCGGGITKQFECYNAGEPGTHLINDLDDPSSWKGLSESKRNSLINLFPNEQVWSGNKNHPDKFCGALGCSEESMGGLASLNSPGRIGDKLEGVPNMLTKKLTWDMATYQVKVKTSKLGTLPKGEGTDANVYIELFGRKSDGNLHTSGEFLLDTPGVNDFERGDTNTFTVIGKEIGELEHITLRHDNFGLGAGWHCDNIVVKNQTTDREWTISVNAWLEKQGNINPFMTLYPQ